MEGSFSESSSNEDVLILLKDNNFSELVETFRENEVDGEDFFDLDARTLMMLIPKLKLRKRFINFWEKTTASILKVNSIKERSSTSISCTSTNSSSSISELFILDDKDPVTPPAKRPREMATPFDKQQWKDSSASDNVKTSSASPADGKDGSIQIHFVLPERWKPEVENLLNKGGPISNSHKNAIVRQLCASALAITSTINQKDREHIALLLTQKYPFLKGSSGAGHEFWAKKINDRVWNLKRCAARNHRKQLAAEGKKIEKKKPGRKPTKMKETTILSIPVIPMVENNDLIEVKRKEIVTVLNNDRPIDAGHVKQLMDATFPYRRKSILLNNIRLKQILRDYPALKDSKGLELNAEFGRVVGNCNFVQEVKEKFEMKRADLLQKLKISSKMAIQYLCMMLEDCDPAMENELENRCIFASLPNAVGEKPHGQQSIGELFWHVIPKDGDVDEFITKSTTPRLLSTGSLAAMGELYLAAEGMVLIKFSNHIILNAVISLLAAFYTINVEYPKGPSGTSGHVYIFLEHLFMGPRAPLPLGVENFLSSLKK